MRIRLMGTRDEVERTVAGICGIMPVREATDWYPNRGGSAVGRGLHRRRTLAHRPVPPPAAVGHRTGPVSRAAPGDARWG